MCEPEIGLDPAVTSRCTASLAGEPISFTVTATNDGRDAVAVDLDDTLLETGPLLSDAQRALRADLGETLKVKCQVAAVIVARRGTRIACTATDTSKHPFSIRLVDASGNYRIDLG